MSARIDAEISKGQELLPTESINSCVETPAKGSHTFHLPRHIVTLHIKIKGFNQSLTSIEDRSSTASRIV